MYQSSLFIEECKKRMTSVSNWGFILNEEKCKDDWALLGWELEGIKIAIEYHPYAFTLSTYVSYRNQDIDTGKLYESVGIKADECRYQFGGSGLEKGIESITDALLSFLDIFDWYDHSDLRKLVSNTYAHQKTENTVDAYFLKKADQSYLSGDFASAKKYYLQYEYALNNLQKRRLARINSMF